MYFRCKIKSDFDLQQMFKEDSTFPKTEINQASTLKKIHNFNIKNENKIRFFFSMHQT